MKKQAVFFPAIGDDLRDDRRFVDAAHVFSVDVQTIRRFLDQEYYELGGLLAAMGTLRRMYIDQHPLCQWLAKRVGLPIRLIKCYDWIPTDSEMNFDDLPPIFQSCAPPRGDRPVNFWVYNIDTYLKLTIGRTANHNVTPRLVIRYFSHKLGAIHFDPGIGRRASGKPEDLTFDDIYDNEARVRLAGLSPMTHFTRVVSYDLFFASIPLIKTLIANEIVPASLGCASAHRSTSRHHPPPVR